MLIYHKKIFFVNKFMNNLGLKAMNNNPELNKAMQKVRTDFLICLCLVIVPLAVYIQTGTYDFVEFDDDDYVSENPHIRAGLNRESLLWAFTAGHSANWHPLTWLSHMLDIELYGMNPGPHHLTNVLFHIANTLLLFLAFRRMTGKMWQSAFIAALFALHPLHVESVAWISERKDVLSTFFWMLTLLTYARYAENPSLKTYLPVFFSLGLGLMSKPMLVTLPCVLLLLDYWPLARVRTSLPPTSDLRPPTSDLRFLILEKLPLFALSAASSAVTFFVQRSAGAVASSEVYSLNIRIANAVISYGAYIEKMIFPYGLAVYYPYPQTFHYWKIFGAFILFGLISLLAVRTVKPFPYIAVGWLWYVGTLVPVIGLVQVGAQSMADRYTYIPLIGIFIMLAWGIPQALEGRRYKKIVLSLAGSAVLLFLMLMSRHQTAYWKNSITLFKHAIEVTADNHLANFNLGVALKEQGKINEAIRHYKAALRIKPDDYKAHTALGDILTEQGKTAEAIRHLSQAMRINPRYAPAFNNQGVAMMKLGKTAEAFQYFSRALVLNPNFPEPHNNLGVIWFNKGETDKAIHHFQKALKTDPDNTGFRNNLKKTLTVQQEEAIAKILEEIKQDPENFSLHYQLGNLYKKKNDLDNAADHYQKALSLQPEFVGASFSLAIIHAKKGEYDRALSLLKKVTEFHPDNPDAPYYIACIFARQNQTEEAADWLKKAIRNGYDDWERLKTDRNLEHIRSTPYYQSIIQEKK
jgi:tetratricopeptide (TPR) repeat protein